MKYVKLHENDKTCDLYLLTMFDGEQYLCTKAELFTLAFELIAPKRGNNEGI